MSEVRRRLAFATVLTLFWSAWCGVFFRVLVHPITHAVSETDLRQVVGAFGTPAVALLAYVPTLALYRLLGGKGSCVRFVFDVLKGLGNSQK